MTNTTTPTARERVGDTLRIVLGLGGLIALILGILIMVNPLKSAAIIMQIVAVIVALYMVGVGVVYLGGAIFSKSMSGWPRTGNIVLGILYVVAGIILFSNLAATAAVLTAFLSIMIGILWMLEGLLAFSTVKASGHKALTVIYGIISVIAGLVLILSPILGAITLWLLLGISMVVMGAIQVVRAFSVKTA